MRLLNAATLKVEEFIGNRRPPYAILSHTWGDEEVTLKDIEQDPDVRKKKGYRKIRYACDHARSEGLDYAWVDTCCIDKTSSAELSEAINSMYDWYAAAKICYAYLADVRYDDIYIGSKDDPALDSLLDNTILVYDLRSSRWFKRGWTLQELIAPREVIFFDQSWSIIGYRNSNLKRIVAEITNIDASVFGAHKKLSRFTIAQKMF